MAHDSAPRSRRSLLAAAGAGAAGIAAASLTRPVRTLAANGDSVKAGTTTFATSPTTVAIDTGSFITLSVLNNDPAADSVSALYAEVQGNHSNAVEGVAASATGDVTGVRGTANSASGTGVAGTGGQRGVLGVTNHDNGRGVLGVANVPGGIGVEAYVDAGQASVSMGVRAEVANDGGIAVVGIAKDTATGILGFTGSTWPTFTPETGVMGYSAASAFSIGVYGLTVDGQGVAGQASGSGTGVYGISDAGRGVYGISSSNNGVEGVSTSAAGVRGASIDGVGAFGHSNNSHGVRGVASTGSGVLGESVDSSGVRGESTHGNGVEGVANAGTGAQGLSNSGIGVEGVSTSGIGVRASSTTGRAISAAGRVGFSSAGRGTIAKGARSKTVTSPVALTATSKVLVTLMGNPGGTTAVQRVAVNVTGKTITVYLTGTATAATPFAFFVID